jgi:linoleoyl-CoA desaturase
MATPKFINVKGSNFHQELKRRVANYFTDSKTPSHGNFSLYFKAELLWTVYVALYIHVLLFPPHIWKAILECFVMGG